MRLIRKSEILISYFFRLNAKKGDLVLIFVLDLLWKTRIGLQKGLTLNLLGFLLESNSYSVDHNLREYLKIEGMKIKQETLISLSKLLAGFCFNFCIGYSMK